MWLSGSAAPCPPSPQAATQRLPGAARRREKRANDTSNLRELALLLPSPPPAEGKKPTKKEILLSVLCYIEYLQRSIDAARALLQVKHRGDKGKRTEHRSKSASYVKQTGRCLELQATTYKEGHEISPPCTPPRIKRSRLLGVCKKPRKNRHHRKAECTEGPKKSRRSLSVEKKKHHKSRSAEDLCLGGNGRGGVRVALPPPSRNASVSFDMQCSRATLLDCSPESDRFLGFTLLDSALEPQRTLAITLPDTILDPCAPSVLTEPQVPSSVTLLEMAGPDALFCTAEHCVRRFQDGSPEEDTCSACEDSGSQLLLLREEEVKSQSLVCYHSSSEEEPESSPWLPAQSPIFGSRGASLICSPGSRGWNGSCWLSRDLGLSPSLFTSPGRLLPGQVLREGTEDMSQVLFEDVRLSPKSPCSFLFQNLSGTLKTEVSDQTVPETPRSSVNLFQSSFSLDHCYLSVSETSKTDSSPSSEVTELVSGWNRQLLHEVPSRAQDCTMSSSDENGDCTWTPYQKGRHSHLGGRKKKRGHSFQRLKALKKHHCTFQLKKKCVNGFIMFCRLNRKQYIRICPGTASTTATKELAHLWRVMSKQERRPYCVKARRFSRLHNRIMKQSCASSEEDDDVTPKPLHLLLAEKAFQFGASPLCHQHHSSQHPAPYTV